MIEKGLYTFCVSACIFMIIVSFSINFVSILNVFGSYAPSPIINQSISDAQKTASGFDINTLLTEAVVALILLLPVLAIAGRVGNLNIVGVYLFGVIFWSSWGSTLSVFSYGGTEYGNWFTNPAMGAIYLMITAAMAFVFAGAAIGMIQGTE